MGLHVSQPKRGTLYIVVTTRLIERIAEHREGRVKGFTKRYKVNRMVHLEPFDDINDAIAREKALKKWRRAWKVNLIQDGNPDWRDLWYDLNR